VSASIGCDRMASIEVSVSSWPRLAVRRKPALARVPTGTTWTTKNPDFSLQALSGQQCLAVASAFADVLARGVLDGHALLQEGNRDAARLTGMAKPRPVPRPGFWIESMGSRSTGNDHRAASQRIVPGVDRRGGVWLIPVR